ncbi:hypothetical protein FISHEDRAFT_69342 [Fistulina hepatica ATCC 64428]|uniref:Mus7/MMS22 family-domain-containing protein n=1 Tax=Fistulina hepatica ATCC 64428 TaxID=1128425 RepID=A0A0D7AQ12_9AGAR|nr:hypothetical protein FISHEDRAFT_69342 [Fistulina hepatica ATCC 64428]
MNSNDKEYVETSDPDEIEIDVPSFRSQRAQQVRIPSTLNASPPYRPRKRVKVHHVYSDASSALTTPARDSVSELARQQTSPGLENLVPSTPSDPTPQSVANYSTTNQDEWSDDELLLRTPLPVKNEGHDVDDTLMPDDALTHVSSPLLTHSLDTSVPFIHSCSRPKLDGVHSPAPVSRRPGIQDQILDDPMNLCSPSPQNIISATTEISIPSSLRSPSVPTRDNLDNHDLDDIHSHDDGPSHFASPLRGISVPSHSHSTTMSIHYPANGVQQQQIDSDGFTDLFTSPPKTPSVPPATPPRQPQRLISMSPLSPPTSSPAAGPSCRRSPAVPSLSPSPPPKRMEGNVLVIPQESHYSLRTRQAKQIKPYEYDKRLYRQTLRNNPDAIVKGLSPRHHHHRTREDVYEDDGTQREGEGSEPLLEHSLRHAHRRSASHDNRRSKSHDAAHQPDVENEAQTRFGLPRELSSSDDEVSADIKLMRREREQQAIEEARERAREEKVRAQAEKERRRNERAEREIERLRREKERERRATKRATRICRHQSASQHSPSPYPLRTRRLSAPSSREEGRSSPVLQRSRSASYHPPQSPPADVPGGSETGNDFLSSGEDLGGVHGMSLSKEPPPFKYAYSPPAFSLPLEIGFSPSPGREPSVAPDVLSLTQSLSRSSHSPSRPTADAVGESDDSGRGSDDDRGSDSEDGSPNSKLKILGRMYPQFMISKLINGNGLRAKKKVYRESDSDGDDGPPRPGQTKARRSTNVQALSEIKGDSESSEEERISIGYSSASSRGVANRKHQRLRISKAAAVETIEITDDDSSDVVDDDDIAAYLQQSQPKHRPDDHRPRREVDLIDRMLARTRTVGVKPEGGRRPRKRHVVLDIMTGGTRSMGKGIQTKLTFENHRKKSNRHHKDSNDGTYRTYQSSNRASPISHIEPDHPPLAPNDVQVSGQAMELTWKEREKLRRERAKKHGIYNFVPRTTRIISGRNDARFVTVDVEDEDFLSAVASHPPPIGAIPALKTRQRKGKHSRHRIHKHRRQPSDLPHSGSDVETTEHEEEQNHFGEEVLGDPLLDSELPVLMTGTSFGRDTMIGRSWLDQLVRSLVRPEPAPALGNYSAFGLDFPSGQTFPEFVDTFSAMCERLWTTLSDIPDGDSEDEAKSWTKLGHHVCRLVTQFIDEAGDERQARQKAICAPVVHFVMRLGQAKFSGASVDKLMLSGCWLSVEVCARAGCCITGSTSPLIDCASVFVRYLVQYDFPRIFEILKDTEHGLDTESTPVYVAELWVCFISVFRLLDASPGSVHPLWQVVMDALQIGQPTEAKAFASSEHVWRTILGLTIMSRFNTLGIAIDNNPLSPAWGLVAYALGQVRLTVDEKRDKELSERSLDARDAYVSIVVARCFQFYHKFGWSLQDSMPMFSELVSIFASRKFSNLRHERSEYPDFVREVDWSLLASYNRRDTAFTVLLKLISAATAVLGPQQIKKLLSSSIPRGALSVASDSRGLSMLYNRISFIAAAIHLDPDNFKTRFEVALTYVAIDKADTTTRINTMRGLMYLTFVLVRLGKPLDSFLKWMEATIDIYDKEISANSPSSKAGRASVFCVVTLLNIVQQIIKHFVYAPETTSRYPEPRLLSPKFPWVLDKSVSSAPKAFTDYRSLVATFFERRRAAMPRPQRPPRVVSEDSQDYFGADDYDFDDPEFVALLGNTDPDPKLEERRLRDDELSKHIDVHRSFLHRQVAAQIGRFPRTVPLGTDYKDVDLCIDLWLSCADVRMRHTAQSNITWATVIDLLQDTWKGVEDQDHRRRLELRVMLSVLQRDPMTFITFKDRYIDLFCGALACARVTIEHEYITLVMSLDGLKHPLFRGIAEPNKNAQGEYVLTPEELTTRRLEIVGALFRNTEDALMTAGNQVALDAPRYVGCCIRFFSALKAIHDKYLDNTDEKRWYVALCRDAFALLDGLPRLRGHDRMGHWMTWRRSLLS